MLKREEVIVKVKVAVEKSRDKALAVHLSDGGKIGFVSCGFCGGSGKINDYLRGVIPCYHCDGKGGEWCKK